MNSIISEAVRKQRTLTGHFMDVVHNNQLSHAYLLCGEPGSGKLALALTITMRLFCKRVDQNYPCGKCNECMRITKHEHPDVVLISPRGQSIKIDQIRYLKAEFSKSAVEGNLKVFIINDADRMTVSAANSLLKFIEEPSGNVVSFLLTNDKSAILPTIVSRTQVVELPSVPKKVFFNELKAADVNPSQYNLLAVLTNDVGTAKKWNAGDWFGTLQKAIGTWFKQIEQGNLMAYPLVQISIMPLIHNHHDREITAEMMIQIWCDVMNVKFENTPRQDLKFPQNYDEITKVAKRITTDQLLNIIDMTLETHQLLTENVNFQNILEMMTLKTLAWLK
ncbi:DNA polymerase III subunit delta' [Acetilactobacillus jinshanensis]|uniref:DNA polymerase III subunit delta n=1 Tax=Acetilactobacillus jinshanensis TaxID=1720083 RepID=A0A4P6ZLS9_9LACO|nr:DNA polymerase III subunit delta' [Acetilactobacillus jinshanensis]QBP18831.1 DNA polymerase III subunit delta' [Acetilactobacillus jinshanensis]URL61698.1 DNA polymerase III subunit delta' [uncultured bacterium]